MALGFFTLPLKPMNVLCQWNTGFVGEQYLTSPTDGVTVGTTTGTPPSALTVRGNEMATPTGEVFRTDRLD